MIQSGATVSPLRPVHISYATANFSQAARMLSKSARRYELETRLYGPGHPVIAALRQRHPSVMNARRGAGYWLWKPFITLDAMNSVPDGTPVLYTDVALTFIANPAPLLALAKDHPVCLFGSSAQKTQSIWTKRDCFVELDADTPEFWYLPQLWGGMQLYRAGPEARTFLRQLCEAMTSETRLMDQPNIHGLPNLQGFRDHRHDQSILTILAHKCPAAIFPDPSQFGPWADCASQMPYGQIVHLHRKRNCFGPKWLFRRLRGHYTGGRGFI